MIIEIIIIIDSKEIIIESIDHKSINKTTTNNTINQTIKITTNLENSMEDIITKNKNRCIYQERVKILAIMINKQYLYLIKIVLEIKISKCMNLY